MGQRQGIGAAMVTTMDYPNKDAHLLLAKVAGDYYTKVILAQRIDLKNVSGPVPFSELETYRKKFENPHEADSLTALKKELEDTKMILHKTMDSMQERGVKLDQLVEKSDRLTDQSKMFYTQAKKQNSCCVVM
jgi:synaptobrevin homolog YKT6